MKFSGFVAAALTVGAAVAAPTKKADPLASVLAIVSGVKDKVAAQLATIRMFQLGPGP